MGLLKDLSICTHDYTGMVHSVLSLNDGTEYPMKDVKYVMFLDHNTQEGREDKISYHRQRETIYNY